MKSILLAALLLALPALAQEYPGDDDLSWQQADEDVPPPPAQGPTLDDFRNDGELAWNGQWIDTPDYGLVWQPTRIDSDWRPYLYGHWAWTDAGWAWVSEEPFGWAVYHYGRWGVAPGIGWFWVPGRVWAPAWVAWRWGDGYAGWCALGPRGVVIDHPRHWMWVDNAHFLEPVRNHVVPRRMIGGSLPPPRSGPRAGPAVQAIERATGRTVRPLVVRDGAGPRGAQTSGNSAYFYRPHTAPVAPQARPQRPIYFGGVPGPAYGGTPRPQAQAPAPPANAPHAVQAEPGHPQASQPHAAPAAAAPTPAPAPAKSGSEHPHVHER